MLFGEGNGFLCGLDLGEWSTRVLVAATRGGDSGCNPGKTAPLLARCLRVGAPEVALESVDCDQRFKLPNPSLVDGSVGSTARLFLRLPPNRNAISDVSTGLCDLRGSTELRAPVLLELREAVRLMVLAEDPEMELEREE